MKKTTAGKAGNERGKTEKTQPIKNEEQVRESNDQKIDQDFPGFPHAPATENAIKREKDLTTKVQEG